MNSNKTSYFLTRGMFLGVGISLLFKMTGKDTYIAATIGLILGLLFNLLVAYVVSKKTSLNDLLKGKLGIVCKIIILLVSLIIFMYSLMIFAIFTTSFLLIKSPEIYTIIPLVVFSILLAFKGLDNIKKVSNCIFIISILLLLFSIIGIFGYFDLENITPIFTADIKSTVKAALLFFGATTLPNILTLHLDMNFKDYIKNYIIGSISIILVIFVTSGVFCNALLHTLRYPEYTVLKQITLFGFIEKIENILASVYLFDSFITCTMSIYSIKFFMPKKKNKYFTVGLILVLIYILQKFFFTNYKNELAFSFKIMPYISIIVPIVLIIPLLYLIKKKKH